MDLTETSTLLNEAAEIDRRRVTIGMVEQWHKIIGHISFDRAQAAMILARQDIAIEYLEPRHILGKLGQAMRQREDDVRAAKARGLVAADWDERDALSSAVREKLVAARESDRNDLARVMVAIES